MQKLAIAVSNNVSFQNFPKDRVVVKLSEAEMTETSVVLMSVEDAEVGALRLTASAFRFSFLSNEAVTCPTS